MVYWIVRVNFIKRKGNLLKKQANPNNRLGVNHNRSLGLYDYVRTPAGWRADTSALEPCGDVPRCWDADGRYLCC